ncbi:MAG TPA: DUF2950 domain-containing protein [Terriglobales bacterium]|nr:DUF2950 domain-containing protein [Terriglobales bacterium]
MSVKTRCKISVSVSILLALIIPLSACNKPEKAAAAGNAQTTFVSPEEAGKALIDAAKSGDQNAVLAIFGPDSKDVIYTGGATQDKEIVQAFISSYQVMNRWRKLDDNTEVLLTGVDNFAFPIPLKKNNVGRWYFDTAAGKDEILARRIGRNELAVIQICGALADAQKEYFSQRHDGAHKKQYALRFISDDGKQNGLYWESKEGASRSPLGPLVAFATSEGYDVQRNSHEPFHGYYFRMLHKQGAHAQGGAKDYVVDGKMVNGFAFVAYPAEYGKSGIMTFIINQNGMTYQKDLGKSTVEAASVMNEFDPDDTWSSVNEESRINPFVFDSWC